MNFKLKFSEFFKQKRQILRFVFSFYLGYNILKDLMEGKIMKKNLKKLKVFGGLGIFVLLVAVFLSSMLPVKPAEPQDATVALDYLPKEDPDVIRI